MHCLRRGDTGSLYCAPECFKRHWEVHRDEPAPPHPSSGMNMGSQGTPMNNKTPSHTPPMRGHHPGSFSNMGSMPSFAPDSVTKRLHPGGFPIESPAATE